MQSSILLGLSGDSSICLNLHLFISTEGLEILTLKFPFLFSSWIKLIRPVTIRFYLFRLELFRFSPSFLVGEIVVLLVSLLSKDPNCIKGGLASLSSFLRGCFSHFLKFGEQRSLSLIFPLYKLLWTVK